MLVRLPKIRLHTIEGRVPKHDPQSHPTNTDQWRNRPAPTVTVPSQRLRGAGVASHRRVLRYPIAAFSPSGD